MKIFYVSLQRCGTKSFGAFARRNGLNVASWREAAEFGWTEGGLMQGRLREIIESDTFKSYTAFEDGPWFDPAVFKYLFWYCPGSLFVYLHRPTEDWFRSMLSHSHGAIIGNPKRHCSIYRRLAEYYGAIERGDDARLSMVGHFDHYKRQFENHALSVRAFFEDKPSNRFFIGDLYDSDKWHKLNSKLNLQFSDLKDVHVHKTENPWQGHLVKGDAA